MLQLAPPCLLVDHIYCAAHSASAGPFWVSRPMRQARFRQTYSSKREKIFMWCCICWCAYKSLDGIQQHREEILPFNDLTFAVCGNQLYSFLNYAIIVFYRHFNVITDDLVRNVTHTSWAICVFSFCFILNRHFPLSFSLWVNI